MSDKKDIETTAAFYGQLFNSSKYVLLVVLIATAIGLYVLPNINATYAVIILLAITLIKIGFIIALSFNQLMKIIAQSHLLSHVGIGKGPQRLWEGRLITNLDNFWSNCWAKP